MSRADSLVQVKTPGLDSTGYVPMRMVSPYFTLFTVKQNITTLQIIDPLIIIDPKF